MSGLSAAAACTRGCASTSVGKRCSSEICRMAVGCSDGAAEVSSGTVWHDRRVVSAPPVELLLAKIGLSAAIVIGVSLAVVCTAAAYLIRWLPDTAPLTRVRTTGLVLAVRAAVSAAAVIGITSAAQI